MSEDREAVADGAEAGPDGAGSDRLKGSESRGRESARRREDGSRSRSRGRRERKRRSRSRSRDRSRSRSRSRDRSRSRSRSRDRRKRKHRKHRHKKRRRRRSYSTDSRSSSYSDSYTSDSRSRSRGRRRKKDRRKDRKKDKKVKESKKTQDMFEDPIEQAKQKLAMEQMQQQLQLAQQWVINQQAGVPGSMNAAIWRRKMREGYVGNLAMNVVNEHILAEVFNSALGELCDNPRGAPPVVQVNMSTDMKYAFVEMRTHALSDAAMHLDGVELCGRVMKVGRPKGWTPDVAKQCAENPGAEDAAAAAAARRFNGEEGADDAAVVKPPFQDDNKDFYRAKINSTEDRTFLRDGIRSNLPDGADVNASFPPTPLGLPAQKLTRRCVFLDNMLAASELVDENARKEFEEDVRGECAKCGLIEAMATPTPSAEAIELAHPGRCYVKFQEEFSARAAREMLDGRVFDGRTVRASLATDEEFERAAAGAWLPPRPPPGDPSLCGILRLRSVPYEATKTDVVNFFYGMGVTEDKVKIVLDANSASTGEAFVEFSGDDANISQALMKDRAVLGSRCVEMFRSSLEEVQRMAMMGRPLM